MFTNNKSTSSHPSIASPTINPFLHKNNMISNISRLIFFKLLFLLSDCCQLILSTVAYKVQDVFFSVVRQPIEDALEFAFTLALYKSQSLFLRNAYYLIVNIFLLVSDDQ
jgi:hypothetical protein